MSPNETSLYSYNMERVNYFTQKNSVVPLANLSKNRPLSSNLYSPRIKAL